MNERDARKAATLILEAANEILSVAKSITGQTTVPPDELKPFCGLVVNKVVMDVLGEKAPEISKQNLCNLVYCLWEGQKVTVDDIVENIREVHVPQSSTIH